MIDIEQNNYFSVHEIALRHDESFARHETIPVRKCRQSLCENNRRVSTLSLRASERSLNSGQQQQKAPTCNAEDGPVGWVQLQDAEGLVLGPLLKTLVKRELHGVLSRSLAALSIQTHVVQRPSVILRSTH